MEFGCGETSLPQVISQQNKRMEFGSSLHVPRSKRHLEFRHGLHATLPMLIKVTIKYSKDRLEKLAAAPAADGGLGLRCDGTTQVHGGGDALFYGGNAGDHRARLDANLVLSGSGEFSGGGYYVPKLDTEHQQQYGTGYSLAGYDGYI